MNFSGYMIVTDLDGTFLARGGKEVERNTEAVRRFCEGGGLFTVATGRLHLNVRSALRDPTSLLNAPAIVSNGGYLYDFQKKETLLEDFIDPEDARDLIAFIRRYCPDIPFRVATPYTVRAEALKGRIKQDVETYDPGTVELISPAESWRMDDWYKLVFREEPEVLAEVRRNFDAVFGDRLCAFASGVRFLEVQRPGCTKAAGILKLRKLLDSAGKRTVIACGDFENDLAMLKEADVAVAPSGAIDLIKEVADFVLCDCNEGLIADVVEGIESGRIARGGVSI
ncbi:MAG: HAD-IIB family hydrolase [Ruminococcaceae bacterium]|nr:HAD-IIB family hydrolase [Oscillospiraceae bacterium]